MRNHLSDGLLVPGDQTNPLIGSRIEVVCLAHLYPGSQLDDHGHGDGDDKDDDDDDEDANGADPHRFLYVRNRLAPLADDGARSNAELKMISEWRKGGRASLALQFLELCEKY